MTYARPVVVSIRGLTVLSIFSFTKISTIFQLNKSFIKLFFVIRIGFEPTMSNLPQRKGSTPMSNYTPDHLKINLPIVTYARLSYGPIYHSETFVPIFTLLIA